MAASATARVKPAACGRRCGAGAFAARPGPRSGPRASASAEEGVMAGVFARTAEYKKTLATSVATTAPPGATAPTTQPAFRVARVGFVENAEIWNTRAAIIGFFALLIVEGVANNCLLTMMGIEVGNGIDIGF